MQYSGIEYIDLKTNKTEKVYDFGSKELACKPYVTKQYVYFVIEDMWSDTKEKTVLYVYKRATDKVKTTYAMDYYGIYAIGGDSYGNILLEVKEQRDDKNYKIKSMNSEGKRKNIGTVTSKIVDFIYARNTVVYYNIEYNYHYWGYDHQMCGMTYANCDGNTFKESKVVIKQQYQLDGVNYYERPTTFLTKNIAMDYLGNVFKVSDITKKNSSGLTFQFAFATDNVNHSWIVGLGSQSAYFSKQGWIVGKNADKVLYAYDYTKKQPVSTYKTKYQIHSVYNYKGSVLVVGRDTKNKRHVEIINPKKFTSIEEKVIDIGKEACYKSRTKSKIISRYKAAIGKLSLSSSIFTSKGSNKKPFKRSVLKKSAQKVFLSFSNYQRWLAGLSSYKIGSNTVIAQTGQGAVLLDVARKATGYMGHSPSRPSGMDKSFYKEASVTTGGNISYAYNVNTVSDVISCIRGLTDDTNNLSNGSISIMDYYEGYNTPGHRNSFLQRGGSRLTYGVSGGVLLQYYEYAQYNPNASGNIKETNNNEMAYAWPSPGLFPIAESGGVWTVYLNTDKLNFGTKMPVIKIKDINTGKIYVRNKEMKSTNATGYSISNFWGKSISFTPPKVVNGHKYTVEISNLEKNDADNGQPVKLTYNVKFFKY